MTISLKHLLYRPRRSVEAIAAWSRLTGGEALFDALRGEVAAQGNAGRWRPEVWVEARDQIASWKKDSIFGNKPAIRETIPRLIDCADLAAKVSASSLDPIERAAMLQGDFVSRAEDRGWMRTFQGNQVCKHMIEVPMAVCRVKPTVGILGTLQLELVEGAGEVYLHPADALTTFAAEDFLKSMEDAWSAACERARHADVSVDGLAGRFRTLQDDGHPIPEISGTSAAGAAALGWYLAMRGMVPDEGVIVMAGIKHDGSGYTPHSVDGIDEKVRAVASYGRFDTIVVGSSANQNEAKNAVAVLNGNNRIRVLVATDL
jgi:hypothetical protein